MKELNETSKTPERLRLALRNANMKQIDLCRITGIDKTTISSYVSGRYGAKKDRINVIADALDVNPAWLMGYDVPMEREKDTPEKIQLSEGEEMLLELFRLIPEDKQKAFLEMGRLYADSLKKD